MSKPVASGQPMWPDLEQTMNKLKKPQPTPLEVGKAILYIDNLLNSDSTLKTSKEFRYIKNQLTKARNFLSYKPRNFKKAVEELAPAIEGLERVRALKPEDLSSAKIRDLLRNLTEGLNILEKILEKTQKKPNLEKTQKKPNIVGFKKNITILSDRLIRFMEVTSGADVKKFFGEQAFQFWDIAERIIKAQAYISKLPKLKKDYSKDNEQGFIHAISEIVDAIKGLKKLGKL